MQILITGGTGFIGQKLCAHLAKNGHKIIILSRRPDRVPCHFQAISSLDEIRNHTQIDLIINLAGAPIAQRWSKRYKAILYDSRIQTTAEIYTLVKRLKKKPEMLLSASAIGYYGSDTDNKTYHEDSHHNEGFTHALCNAWEKEAMRLNKLDVPVAILRFGVVLGPQGGMLKKTLPVFRMGLGGQIGTGKQLMSWIHIDDVIGAIDHIVDRALNGTFNLTSPNPVTNTEFSLCLSTALNKPCFFDLPAPLVKILFGEMGETLLLKGQNVFPKRLSDSGFNFKYARLKESIDEIINSPDGGTDDF